MTLDQAEILTPAPPPAGTVPALEVTGSLMGIG